MVLALAIGSFSIAALMGIIALVGGGGFGETQASLLLTAAGQRGGWVLDGTLLASSLLALIVIAQVLSGDSNEVALRVTGILGILDVLGAVVTIGLARFGARPPVRLSGVLALPPDLRAALDDRADATGRPSADLLADAVRSYLRD
ncbi:ribbon-helix-helix domain-containing protein [Nocardioides nematodiphilus]|uniref:ribbon-helix-helix domain-containing protein n=1 Tax=Nocardioides nematodiphilus TaxID=2849669 RepID=UPI001CD966AB|nr:ribbon-helix-helix domain-containing protein [Nocardioides nematodiphilus]MCA1983542.1 ribbon-helix-helix domain-containing protein [Nocardioides nematodiphilus]